MGTAYGEPLVWGPFGRRIPQPSECWNRGHYRGWS